MPTGRPCGQDHGRGRSLLQCMTQGSTTNITAARSDRPPASCQVFTYTAHPRPLKKCSMQARVLDRRLSRQSRPFYRQNLHQMLLTPLCVPSRILFPTLNNRLHLNSSRPLLFFPSPSSTTPHSRRIRRLADRLLLDVDLSLLLTPDRCRLSCVAFLTELGVSGSAATIVLIACSVRGLDEVWKVLGDHAFQDRET